MGGVIDIVSPAPFLAAREMFRRDAGLKPLAGRVLTYQLSQATTYGFLVEGALVMTVGLWPHGGGLEEVFMGFAPPEQLARLAIALTRAGRLTLRRRMQDAQVDRFVAWVASSPDAPGHRLARAAGFVPCVAEPPGAFLLWELRRGS